MESFVIEPLCFQEALEFLVARSFFCTLTDLCSGLYSYYKIVNILPEAAAGDHEVRLCGLEDVVDGSGGQHLPRGLIDHLLIVATAHCHGAQEAHDKHLLQEGVCKNIQTSKSKIASTGNAGTQTHKRRLS